MFERPRISRMIILLYASLEDPGRISHFSVMLNITILVAVC